MGCFWLLFTLLSNTNEQQKESLCAAITVCAKNESHIFRCYIIYDRALSIKKNGVIRLLQVVVCVCESVTGNGSGRAVRLYHEHICEHPILIEDKNINYFLLQTFFCLYSLVCGSVTFALLAACLCEHTCTALCFALIPTHALLYFNQLSLSITVSSNISPHIVLFLPSIIPVLSYTQHEQALWPEIFAVAAA